MPMRENYLPGEKWGGERRSATISYALTNLLPESCFTTFLISRMSKVLETTEVGSFVMRIISSMSLGLLDRSENIFFSWELSDKLRGSFVMGTSDMFKVSAIGPSS